MYIPITKAKQGDLDALRHLNPEILSGTKPLIQIPQTPSEVDTIITRINAALASKSATVYLDFGSVSNTENSLDYIQRIFNGIDSSIRIIPVLYSNTSAEKLQIYAPFIANNGTCLRVKGLYGNNNTANEILTIINSFELIQSNVDVLLDYEYVNTRNIDDVANDCIHTVAALAGAGYRSLGIASGSFMENLGSITADTVHEFPRTEHELYERVKNHLEIDVFFSDYGNQHPLPGDVDINFAPSCSIKYTSDNSYVVFRGQQPGKVARGSAQYFDKVRLLVEHDCYDGPEFSWADRNIFERAETTDERHPGNAGTWVTITMNRHITKVHYMVN